MVDYRKNSDFLEGSDHSFDSATDAVEHVGFDQARTIALQTARSEPGEYGRFTTSPMAFDIEYEYETEDHYVITLFFRPQNKFAGAPGREQFFIEKEGLVARRHVASLPDPERLWRASEHLPKPTPPDNDPISVPWSVTDMVIGAAAVVGFIVLLRLLVSFFAGGLDGLAVVWMASASEGVLVYVVWKLAVKKYGIGWDSLGFRSPTTRHNALLIAATLVGSLILTGVYAALVTQLNIEILMPKQLPVDLLRGEAFGRLVTIVAIAGFVPIVEEIFFRGFLFQGLASRYGLVWGAVFSSAVFAVAHLSIGTMIPIFLIGLLFAALYAKTRSVWMPMSAHAIQNLAALTLAGA